MVETATSIHNENGEEKMLTREERAKGAIYGFAIGDAMGAVAEFETAESIEMKYGRITEILGGGWLKLKPGEVTDDTQMTFCIFNAMKAYAEGKWTAMELTEMTGCEVEMTTPLLDMIKHNFTEWKKSGPKDIGNLCMNGITLMEQGLAPEYDPEALGNGSLMRALPFALVGNEEMNIEQGLLTHNNDTCTEMILRYHQAIQLLINGILPSHINIGLQNPSGHVKNTYENAMYWAFGQDTKCFRDAVEGAVNDGGDADTIAAIAGSLAGARFGYDNIPVEWIETLDDCLKKLLDEYESFANSQEFIDLFMV